MYSTPHSGSYINGMLDAIARHLIDTGRLLKHMDAPKQQPQSQPLEEQTQPLEEQNQPLEEQSQPLEEQEQPSDDTQDSNNDNKNEQ